RARSWRDGRERAGRRRERAHARACCRTAAAAAPPRRGGGSATCRARSWTPARGYSRRSGEPAVAPNRGPPTNDAISIAARRVGRVFIHTSRTCRARSRESPRASARSHRPRSGALRSPMRLLLAYLRRHSGLVALALLLAAVNQIFSLLDPLFL